MESEVLFRFLDETLGHEGFPDYPSALNGLQIEGPKSIARFAVAVDGTLATVEAAVAAEAELLIVHHGLFWDGFGPIVGRRYRRIAAALEGGLAVYASHLPLDAHPVLGNSAVLARELGIQHMGTFGEFSGRDIGVWGELGTTRGELEARLERAANGPVRVVPGGPEQITRVGVVTGAGSSMLGEAVALGLDTLVTGEAPHHAFHDATELGANLLLGGHYATETFGVRALAALIQERFGLPWEFLDYPTGF